MNDGWEAWVASRKATNQLLGFMIVVLAAGFVSLGGGYGGLQIVAELLLMLILLGAIILFLAALLRNPDS
ncbi:hypothetical protein [Halosolutus gelatinilyticus]|uniref:hypothetical protein n=1 Tax=Halosolutus gelatinilyticus TaxID=2931975 RepID=UPI001FF222C1|nr:hypothetical protein [Halosolutus gelatinilyticus]